MALPMFGLADVNSFYASCESLFRPDLRGKPVIVLSNNDGCVIARSAGAKALGIKMGAPWFQIKNEGYIEKIHVFSSNYGLYHSLSQRVMTALEEITPRVEQYSIDEMFLDLTGIDGCEDFEHFGRRLRAHVLTTTGLTVGVGMGPTKTLAKSAQWAGKEWKQFRGVLALTPGNPKRTATLLQNQPVEEVWGVGRRIAKRLNLMGIENALQLSRANPSLIRKNFSVVLERTVRELNGESCIPLEEIPPAKQQICCSRSLASASPQKWPCSRPYASTRPAPQRSSGENGSSAGASACLSGRRRMRKTRCFTATAPARSSACRHRTRAISSGQPCARSTASGWTAAGT